MKFTKQFLKDLLWGDFEDDVDAEIVEDVIVDNRRWTITHYMVFKYEGKFYGTDYSVGATEQQDEAPFEYSDDIIECDELVPVEIKKIEYMTLKEAEKHNAKSQ